MDSANQTNQNTPTGVCPHNYLVWSILVTIFCCQPLGIVGIINATKVNSAFAAGDMVGAQQASSEAAKWVKYGAVGGIVVYVLVILFFVIFGLGIIGLAGMSR